MSGRCSEVDMRPANVVLGVVRHGASRLSLAVPLPPISACEEGVFHVTAAVLRKLSSQKVSVGPQISPHYHISCRLSVREVDPRGDMALHRARQLSRYVRRRVVVNSAYSDRSTRVHWS
ncbi:hypothetical protein C2E23DRAFT_371317 [Lenzites betulinus]|nr:hypothetical protein C2E23DRAFT_371317 [Lenzites betulinus]